MIQHEESGFKMITLLQLQAHKSKKNKIYQGGNSFLKERVNPTCKGGEGDKKNIKIFMDPEFYHLYNS